MLLAGFDVGVVGGSLGGLSVANVLARHGANVRVFERAAPGFERRGGGLAVDLRLAQDVVAGARPPPHVVVPHRRSWLGPVPSDEPIHVTTTSYGALWSWLRAPLAPGTLVTSCAATVVEGGTAPQLATADRGNVDFDLVVCADGGSAAAHVG